MTMTTTDIQESKYCAHKPGVVATTNARERFVPPIMTIKINKRVKPNVKRKGSFILLTYIDFILATQQKSERVVGWVGGGPLY